MDLKPNQNFDNANNESENSPIEKLFVKSGAMIARNIKFYPGKTLNSETFTGFDTAIINNNNIKSNQMEEKNKVPDSTIETRDAVNSINNKKVITHPSTNTELSSMLVRLEEMSKRLEDYGVTQQNTKKELTDENVKDAKIIDKHDTHPSTTDELLSSMLARLEKISKSLKDCDDHQADTQLDTKKVPSDENVEDSKIINGEITHSSTNVELLSTALARLENISNRLKDRDDTQQNTKKVPTDENVEDSKVINKKITHPCTNDELLSTALVRLEKISKRLNDSDDTQQDTKKVPTDENVDEDTQTSSMSFSEVEVSSKGFMFSFVAVVVFGAAVMLHPELIASTVIFKVM